MAEAILKRVQTSSLEIAYEESGPIDGIPVILLHGFPDDVRTWDGVTPGLTKIGCRIIVPYLRGYGPTRFLSKSTMRSGQQAALGSDLIGLMDALKLDKASLVGYDWGGRAACIVAALWPERVHSLVSIGGYNVQIIADSQHPETPDQEHRFWYQWYFNMERGQAGLKLHGKELCRTLWKLWSPNWQFDVGTFELTAKSFENPDFLEIVIHSYRHRYGTAPGDPALENIEEKLATQPRINVPTVVLHGECDGVDPAENSEDHSFLFLGPYERKVIPVAGHLLPRESPDTVVTAVTSLVRNGQH